MGADYLEAKIVLAQHTDDREAQLNELIATLDDQDFKEFWDMEGGLPEPDSQEEEDAAVAAGYVAAGYVDETSLAVYVSRQRYKEWAKEYWDLDGRRDCGVSRQPDGLQFIESGGTTWGDDPTESFRVISCLNYVDKVLDQLLFWAQQDNLPQKDFAVVAWRIGDITSRTDLTDEQAAEFLTRNAKHIQERLTEFANEHVIPQLLQFDGIDITEGD